MGIKRRWDKKFPERARVSKQNPRYNAVIFKNETGRDMKVTRNDSEV